jgi:Fe-S cluster assembly iron-binding protein IscA
MIEITETARTAIQGIIDQHKERPAVRILLQPG